MSQGHGDGYILVRSLGNRVNKSLPYDVVRGSKILSL